MEDIIKHLAIFYSKKNTLIETKDYILKGEEVFYDKVADTSLAIDKVSIYNKEKCNNYFFRYNPLLWQ